MFFYCFRRRHSVGRVKRDEQREQQKEKKRRILYKIRLYQSAFHHLPKKVF